MGRTIVIGDIHGGLKALEQVLGRADVTADDALIFLGDYVDGWPDSAGVIEHLFALNETHHCVFLRGNHDAWCENWLANGTADHEWLFHGGRSTVESYASLDSLKKSEHLSFFQRMKDYHEYEDRLFIHAGFSSMHGPSKEHYATNFSWDRTLWEVALATDTQMSRDSSFYPKRLKLYDEIYIGHTPTINYGTELPMQAMNVWNIDTGAAFTGKLTAIDVESKQFWQSDSLQSLYPNDKGRNK